MKKLYFLFTIILCAAMPIMAQHTDDNCNKAVFQSTDGNNEVSTDDIQLIRFEGGKVTVVQPWGETVFDHTLQNLTFFRPQSGTLRLTVDANIGTSDNTNRAFSIDGSGRLAATWESGDVVYVYADETADEASPTPIGTLTPSTTGSNTARLVGNIDAAGLDDGQTLYLETQPRTYDMASQTGVLSNMFYAKATATVSITGGNATISDATFTRPMAVAKFTLKDKAYNGTTPLNATSLTVTVGSTNYTVTPATPAHELFVAIPSINTGNVTLTATVGTDTYVYTKTGVTFENGHYYTICVKMTRQANPTDIGKIIAQNGCIYENASAASAAGTEAVAVIAYIGNESDCAHGLAIAFSDESGDKSFGNAGKAASQKNTALPVVGGTWRIPSKSDWQNMFIACRKEDDASAPATDMKIAGFQEKINSTGTGFAQGTTYWTSTDSPSAFCVYFSDTTQASIQGNQEKMSDYIARAVLAF